MTTVVIDASAALSCCFDDEAGAAEDIDALAEVAVMLVPGCFLPEVANALLSGARRGRMTPERAVELLDAMLDIRWHVDPEPRGSTQRFRERSGAAAAAEFDQNERN